MKIKILTLLFFLTAFTVITFGMDITDPNEVIYADGTDDPNSIDAGIAGLIGGEVNPVFLGWASGVADYSPSDETGFYGLNGIGESTYTGDDFADPNSALGAVTGNQMNIVALGDINWEQGVSYDLDNTPGNITFTFDEPVSNSPGPDFAVFENGFGTGGTFSAELAFVEVSTNGEDFTRFPNYYNAADGPVGPYGTLDVTKIYNLAGKHVNSRTAEASFGTPFNLSCLEYNEEVIEGMVNLHQINYIRIVDIPGNGYFTDSFGNLIYDPWETWGSGGIDIEAVGIIKGVYGDADSNGRVDANDWLRLARNWKKTGGWPQGDFNEDGIIDAADLHLLANNWLLCD